MTARARSIALGRPAVSAVGRRGEHNLFSVRCQTYFGSLLPTSIAGNLDAGQPDALGAS